MKSHPQARESGCSGLGVFKLVSRGSPRHNALLPTAILYQTHFNNTHGTRVALNYHEDMSRLELIPDILIRHAEESGQKVAFAGPGWTIVCLLCF